MGSPACRLGGSRGAISSVNIRFEAVYSGQARWILDQLYNTDRSAYNRVRQDTGGTCWLVIEEPGRLTLAFLQHGLWIAIRSRRVDERWRYVLPEIIERESALLGLEERCTRVIVCAHGQPAAPCGSW